MTHPIAWQAHGPSQILTAFLGAASEHQARLAIWRETATDRLFVLVSFVAARPCSLTERLPAGFIYTSFSTQDGTALVLPAQLLYEFQGNRLVRQQGSPPQLDGFSARLQQCLRHPVGPSYHSIPMAEVGGESQADFIKLIHRGLAEIRQGALQKVVLARTQTLALQPGFDPLSLFLQLSQIPGQFVSLLSSPEEGSWLGCSPELLLALEGEAIHTVSLAGTIPKGQGWSDKEYREQEWVNTFIRDSLRQLGLEQVRETPFDTMSIGTFKHLRTHFELHPTPQQHQAGIFGQLLSRLHPSPALCGMPQQAARAFIEAHEGFQRHLYTGYLGHCHIKPGQIRLYANIRCMQLFQDHARLFLGAGITEESDPQSEWQETCLKSRTLLDAL
jgi:isochorismate synthase